MKSFSEGSARAMGLKNNQRANPVQAKEAISPVGIGPNNKFVCPWTKNNGKPEIPLIAACPITAGHTLPLRKVIHAKKVPIIKQNHTIAIIPFKGAPG
ncbi:MAG: hypothetical protein MUO26_16285 [Methanotrichaceae archaeon]|nr:hypothetical protein [Methanotrichaceae archaeon]